MFQECLSEGAAQPRSSRGAVAASDVFLTPDAAFPSSMDPHLKSGKVYLQAHKHGKKWKPVWLSLFPPSSSGVGRLEIRDLGGGPGGDHSPGVRRHHQAHLDRKVKVMRLPELISVLRLPPNAEACPMENMSAFCVEVEDRTVVFSAPKDECVDWVDKLCQSSFKTAGVSSSAQVHMEDNQIYASADEAPQFQVVIQRTDAATRCGLQGSFWLQVGHESLLLTEPQKKTLVLEWPYEHLRRYGKEKLALTIEAGRRCDSGPGTFSFETQQAEKIFSLIQSTIKRKTLTVTPSSQPQEGEKVLTTTKRAHSPLPKIQDVTNMFASLESKLRRSPVFTESSTTQEDSTGRSESAPAPITLMPLPSVPPQDGPRGGHGQSDGIYADPQCCIPSIRTPQPTTALYVDPASVLPLKPPNSLHQVPSSPAKPPTLQMDVHDSVYSEVYDKISPDQNKQSVLPSTRVTAPPAGGEPIYHEPLGKPQMLSQKTETRPDPFAHLYAKVCKTGGTSPTISTSPPSITASTTAADDEPLDDVIYENLGII